MNMFSIDPERVCYGYQSVQAAFDQLAISELLITDQMYRSDDYNLRHKYIELMENVVSNGMIRRHLIIFLSLLLSYYLLLFYIIITVIIA